jgi:hypothetical protein
MFLFEQEISFMILQFEGVAHEQKAKRMNNLPATSSSNSKFSMEKVTKTEIIHRDTGLTGSRVAKISFRRPEVKKYGLIRDPGRAGGYFIF